MDAVASPSFPQQNSERWFGGLDLRLSRREQKTYISHLAHQGPLRVQRPFYPENSGCAHVYLLHPPGGVVGGDQIQIDLTLDEGAHGLITTPAANKLYRSAGQECEIVQRLAVQEDAFLEWLPQETIAFSGARAHVSTLVSLEEGAKFFGWEILCLGRPESGEVFTSGRVNQRLEIWREESPLFVDRLLVHENSDALTSSWGLKGNCVTGTVTIACEAPGLESLIKELLQSISLSSGLCACSALKGALLVRYVGTSVEECWKCFVLIWKTARPLVCGLSASAPRIWNY